MFVLKKMGGISYISYTNSNQGELKAIHCSPPRAVVLRNTSFEISGHSTALHHVHHTDMELCMESVEGCSWPVPMAVCQMRGEHNTCGSLACVPHLSSSPWLLLTSHSSDDFETSIFAHFHPTGSCWAGPNTIYTAGAKREIPVALYSGWLS